jgi:hypothetical protein
MVPLLVPNLHARPRGRITALHAIYACLPGTFCLSSRRHGFGFRWGHHSLLPQRCASPWRRSGPPLPGRPGGRRVRNEKRPRSGGHPRGRSPVPPPRAACRASVRRSLWLTQAARHIESSGCSAHHPDSLARRRRRLIVHAKSAMMSTAAAAPMATQAVVDRVPLGVDSTRSIVPLSAKADVPIP